MNKKYTIELPKSIEVPSSNIFKGKDEIELTFNYKNNTLYVNSKVDQIIKINDYNENKTNYNRDILKSKEIEYSKVILDKYFNKIELYLDGYPNDNPIILTLIK
ncbi:hypothetical protein ACTS9E_14565 [Empedobacter brevis]